MAGDRKKSARSARGRPFQKGQSGNPSGGPKLTPQQALVKAMTREQFAEMAHLMMTQGKEQLEDLIAQRLPYEQELFIRHMLALGENPDWNQYERYLSRRIGKLPQPVEVEGIPAPEVTHSAIFALIENLAKGGGEKDGDDE